MSFDLSVSSALRSLTTSLPYLNWLYIFLAQYLIFIVAIIIWTVIFLEKDRKERFYHAFLAVLSVIFSFGVISQTIAFFYHRTRPFVALHFTPLVSHVPDASFPSDHLALVTPIAILAFYINKKLGIWLSVFTILIGVSRVIVGVHWPTDILGGMAIGAVSFYLAKAIIPKPKASN